MAMVKVSAVKEGLPGESVGIKAGLNGISVSNIRDLEKNLIFLSGSKKCKNFNIQG